MLWDEENRLLAVSDNGFVSNYWYDASGERTVKESGDNEGVTVNGLQSAVRSGTTNFTAYISPYLVVSNGGNYTKHIYMGGQRITSKVSNSGIFTTSPVTTIDLQAKYTAQTAKIKERFDSLRVTYKGTPQSGGLISKDTSTPTGSYFYHSDHLGSSSLITDASGAIVQHLEYVPFGETFIDERRSQSSWTTPYLFSGKEQDEETGLLYFGARYQDSKYGIWYSVDPLAEKYPDISSYVYCHNNPVNMIDPDGMEDVKYSNLKQKWHTFDVNKDNVVLNAATVVGHSTNRQSSAEGNATRRFKINFSNSANRSVISNYSLGVIKDVMERSNNLSLQISRSKSSPEEQIEIMYRNTTRLGKPHQLSLYGSKGDEIIKLYPDKDEMLKMILQVGPQNISKHCGDFNKLNVIDIAPSSVMFKSAFINAVREDPRVSKFLFPRKDPAFHLEIKQ